MKMYWNLKDVDNQRNLQNQLDGLLFFQEMLLTVEGLNERFGGRAQEIASGLQPWIEVLRWKLNQ